MLRFEGVGRQFSASVDSQTTLILEMAVLVGRDVVLPIVVSVLSNYIYDKLKDRKAESIKIGNTYIKINNTQINVEQIYQTIINEASQKKEKTQNLKTELP